MELNRKSWFVRWFFWSLGIWEAFLNKYEYSAEYVEKQGTNLCFFIRVITVWAPLVLLLHVALAVAAVFALTALPVHWFGGAAYGWTVVAIAAVAAIVFSIMATVKAVERNAPPAKAVTADWEMQKRRATQKQKEQKKSKGPTFWDVVWAYVVAAKQKICPTVKFSNVKEG